MTLLLPGDDGADSPDLDTLDAPLTVAEWTAWLHLGADRGAGRPTPQQTLATALNRAGEPVWALWWDRTHPRGRLTHIAALLARTLVTRCGYSTPARPDLAAWEIGDRAARDDRRTYCTSCTHNDPRLPTA